MAQSIKMYKIETYPTEFPLQSEDVTNRGIERVNFKTTVKLLGDSEYERTSLKKLQIIHEIGSVFTGQGILEDGSIHNIIATSNTEVFPAFVKDETYLYTSGTKREVSVQAIKRLRQFKRPDNFFVAQNVKINLTDFKAHLEESNEGAIKGGWFRGMQVKNVEVAYLGGGAVTASDDWERYETSGGTISAMRIDLPLGDIEDEPTKVLLTHDGNCVVYKNVGEHDLLSIAVPLFEAAEQFIE
ncbi:hypothetical protein [Bacillus mycoides]|uniref:hypothetical protein n=1 Tax=Bacillus mycoides TaxID=1405 RepID=UPI0025A04585|nr:hypothetical protein [Bacillus mycoides]MDM5429079.1 hypothetical protein [Bacillus mycoides]